MNPDPEYGLGYSRTEAIDKAYELSQQAGTPFKPMERDSIEKAWDKDKYKYLKNEFHSTDINSPMAYNPTGNLGVCGSTRNFTPIEWFSIDLRQLTESTMTIKILRIDQVTEQTGLSRSSVYKQIRLGRFPRTIKRHESSAGRRALFRLDRRSVESTGKRQ